MKKYRKIDYRFAPACYWDEPDDMLAQLLRNVQGTARREMIREFWNRGYADALGREFTQPVLPHNLRDALASVSLLFMGGEYLPDYLPGEVEIARVETRTRTAEVISVRARPYIEGAILYRIVDEYETEFGMNGASSETPLTLEELISLLESTGELGLVVSLIQDRVADGEPHASASRDFVAVKSDLYRDLSVHYRHAVADYIAENKPKKEKTQ